MSISAIILAAGYSSRMQGKIKALLPFADTTMLGLAVRSLESLTKQNIWVVTGFESTKLNTEAQNLGVSTLYNADFDKGMFSSICVGVKQAIANKSQALFVLPVDALVGPQTVQFLLQAYEESKVIIPYFEGQSGHPPLIAASHFQAILDFGLDGGLQAYFATLTSEQLVKVELYDQGIVSDIDTPELYDDALKWQSNKQNLCFVEAILWQSNLPLGVIKHCYSVALSALRLSLALEQKKCKVNHNWSLCAGLVHDIKRLEKKHAQAAQEFLSSLALDDIAQIVAVHTNIPKKMLEAIEQKNQNKYDESFLLASLVVYMADKLHYEQEQVSVFERFARTRAEYLNDSQALKKVEQREKVAIKVEKYLTALIGESPEKVIKRSTTHALEVELLMSQKARFS